MTLRVGDRVGRYRLREVLGEGGMSTVFRAEDPNLERDVALKVLRGDAAHDGTSATELAGRMFREARSAASLSHPNAVAVYDFGETDGHVYLAMEYVKGVSLRELLAATQASWAERLRWLVDVASLLAAAHEHGLVHRDIKPENVMVRGDGIVKVLDFGIAKRVRVDADESAGDGDTTRAGALVGTPHYMSPEQLRNETLDGRSDQFAWGVLAYEVLSGRLPWNDGEGGVKLVLSIVEQEPKPLGQLVPDLPPVVVATIHKAMAKHRKDRFATMDAIVEALDTYAVALTPPPVTAGPGLSSPLPPDPTLLTAPPAAAVRRKVATAVAVVAAAAAGVLAGGVVKPPSFVRAVAARPSAARPVASASSTPSALPWYEAVVARAPSSNAKARDAFLRAMTAFRAGTFELARVSMREAMDLDPGLASARLRLAALDGMIIAASGEGRRVFRQAQVARPFLSPDDALLLTALEPWMQEDPPDLELAAKRLAIAAEASPTNPEPRFFLGLLRLNAGKFAQAVDAFDAALALDGGFAQALAFRAQALAYTGEMERAQATASHCLEISPAATDCTFIRVAIHEALGRCTEMETEARAWIEQDPGDYYGYALLAKALVAQRRPRTEVETMLHMKAEHAGPDRSGTARLNEALHLDLAEGRFDRAEERLAEIERLHRSSSVREVHDEAARFLVDVLVETGRPKEAVRRAASYLAMRDIWSPPSRVDDTAILSDPTPHFLALLAAHGLSTPADTARRRDEWIRGWEARSSSEYRPYLWLAAYAGMSTTEAAARDALAAQPRFGTLPAFMPIATSSLDAGTTYRLAGRGDLALTHLRTATSSCSYLDDPIRHVRGLVELADVHASRGERALACDALENVFSRWPAPRPRSVTIEAARAKAEALGCPRRGL